VLDDTVTFAPFNLLEYEHVPGTFCLVLFDASRAVMPICARVPSM
jgi:hypothetical protein